MPNAKSFHNNGIHPCSWNDFGTIFGRFWNDRGTAMERIPASQMHDLMSETDRYAMAHTHIAYSQ